MGEITRIGIFLATRPHDGGAHQHSLNVVDALATFPGRYRIVPVYRGVHWEESLTSRSLRGVPLPIGFGTDSLVKFLRFGVLPLWLWRKAISRVNPAARLMRRQACDLWLYPAQDDWTYLGPQPAVGTIHDLMHRYESQFPEVSSGAKFNRRERHYKRICRTACSILVDSDTGRRHVMESYGVDFDRLHPLPFIAPRYLLKDCRDVEPADLPLPPKYLFYPAQFWRHKNHERLLQALAGAKSAAGDIRLVLVGSEKNNLARIKKLIAELGLEENVLILGYVENRHMGTLYRRARALVMPTFFGPTNLPPLEAFACACPVAASNVYGMPEQLGDAGLLFDPGSIPEIRDVLVRLWLDDELCRDLSRRSMQAAARWGFEAFSKRLLDIIERTCEDLAIAQLRRSGGEYRAAES